MKKRQLLCTLLICFHLSAFAQIVETIAGPNPRVNNGLVVHTNGEIYASDLFGSGFNGNRIHKITPDGASELFAIGLSQPAGLVFGSDGLLYVAEFSSGEISTVDASGNISRFVAGLNNPADLVFDKKGNLFVTNYGNGTISKITPQGTTTTFASGFRQPVGLALDDNGYLYAANLTDARIYRIDTLGNKGVIATLPDRPIGFMTFASNKLYVASTGSHRIYELELNGTYRVLSGNGIAGTVDGELAQAQFTSPDGIAASASGDTLYVSENNSNLLRRILLDQSTSISFFEEKELKGFAIFPNPAQDYINISYQLLQESQIVLKLYSSQGQLIRTIVEEQQRSGQHQHSVAIMDLPSGIYYCQISNGTSTEKRILNITH